MYIQVCIVIPDHSVQKWRELLPEYQQKPTL